MNYEEFETFLSQNVGRFELINGIPLLKPVASTEQFEANRCVKGLLCFYSLRNNHDSIFHPYITWLDGLNNVYVPDACIVLNLCQLSSRGYEGAPDLAVEILSPFSTYYIKEIKKSIYFSCGTREYWIVDPIHKFVEVWYGIDSFVTYYNDDNLVSSLLPGLTIRTSLLFSNRENPELVEYLRNILFPISERV